LITIVIVFVACIALTEVLARTVLAKPLTGRSRIMRRVPVLRGDGTDAPVTEPLVPSASTPPK
jgi:hypothetical protein